MQSPLSATSHHAFPVGGLLFGFLGSMLLGVLVGFAYLATVPPVSIQPSESKPAETSAMFLTHFENEVRYFQRSGFRQNAQALTRKLYASQTEQIDVNALELNAWAEVHLAPHSPASTAADSDRASILSLAPDVPVFHIASHKLHLSYPATLQILSMEMPLRLIASGDFSTGTRGPTWNAQRLYLNSAPLPFKKWSSHLIMNQVMRALETNAEVEKMQTAWRRIRSIEITATSLLLQRS
ncbi:MAG: hypothetical protein ABQ298_05490 [Puniceicoccaceae bacterium]